MRGDYKRSSGGGHSVRVGVGRTTGIQAPAVLVLWVLCQLELYVLSAPVECVFTAFLALQAGLLEPGCVCKGASTAQ
jgi:hypothetical protein